MAIENKKSLGEIAEVVNFSDKLRVYKGSLAFAYTFVIYGMVIVGGMVCLSAFIESPWREVIEPYADVLFATTLICSIVIATMLVGILLKRLGIPKTPGPKYEGARWSCSFFIPFCVLYTVAGICHTAYLPFWYLALGIAFLSVGILVEDWHVKQKLLYARPFLYGGILIIITAAIAFYISSLWGYDTKAVGAMQALAGGLCLLTYFAVSYYTILRTERVFSSK